MFTLNESRLVKVIALSGRALDNGQWKEGILIGILAEMRLTKCHRVAVFEYSGIGAEAERAVPRGNLLFYRRDRHEQQFC